ncbi:MAG: hypothetical protein RL264_2583 [Bacteroidota bacterium]|jgi:hypothetical protein
MLNNRKVKNIWIILPVLLTVLFSCSEPKPPQSRIDRIVRKIESGTHTKQDLDVLVEEMQHGKGEFQIVSSEDHFKITFPVTNVKQTTTKELIDNKEVEIFHYTANMEGEEHENLAYQLDYMYIPEIKTRVQINELFDSQRDYLISATNSKLEYEKIIEKNKAPGRHLYFTVDASKIKATCNLFFNDGVFFKITVFTEEGNLFNPLISKFLNSFKITK